MNRKYFLSLAVFLSLQLARGQEVFMIDDFENTGKNWMNISNSTSQIVDNPSPDAENPSSKVLKCVRQVGSDNWAGVILRGVYSLNIGIDDDSYSYATVKFLKTTTGNVSFKLESGPDGETFESDRPYTSSNGWTTITFDLKNAKKGTYNDFFVMVDREDDLQQDATVYIDDITLLKKADNGREEHVDPKSQNGTGETNGYQLVWQDLFDNGSLDDVWNIEENDYGGYNNELQYYSKENISVEDDADGNGCLIITARKEDSHNRQFTSGRLNTKGNMKVCHGKIEASIRLPKTANGLWPAFWMMGDAVDQWPCNGEIDILEMGNSEAFANDTQDRFFNGACHWGPSTAEHKMSTQTATWDYPLQDDAFHLYTLYWDDQKISMYVDQDRFPNSRPYFQMNISDKSSQYSAGNYFHHEFHLLFNLAVGGDFPSLYNAEGITALQDGEAKMFVNYVKVYQKGVQGESYTGPIIDHSDIDETPAEWNSFCETDGVVYNIQGLRMAEFKVGRFQEVFTQLEEGIYIIRFENAKAHKVVKRK